MTAAPRDLPELEAHACDLAERAGSCGYAAVVVVLEVDPEGGRPGVMVSHLPDGSHLRQLTARALRIFAGTLDGPAAGAP